MNDLEQFFYNTIHRPVVKYPQYFDIYHTHLNQFRNISSTLLELGIAGGGSLQMWKSYLGNAATIYGFDSNDGGFIEDQIKFIIGRQDNKEDLESIKSKISSLDIIIDDCSHFSEHQILTFNTLFSHLNNNGIYICEDVYTSYQLPYLKDNKISFVNYIKDLVDILNLGHEIENKEYLKFVNIIKSIHFYSGIVVIEKGSPNASSPIKIGVL